MLSILSDHLEIGVAMDVGQRRVEECNGNKFGHVAFCTPSFFSVKALLPWGSSFFAVFAGALP